MLQEGCNVNIVNTAPKRCELSHNVDRIVSSEALLLKGLQLTMLGEL